MELVIGALLVVQAHLSVPSHMYCAPAITTYVPSSTLLTLRKDVEDGKPPEKGDGR